MDEKKAFGKLTFKGAFDAEDNLKKSKEKYNKSKIESQNVIAWFLGMVISLFPLLVSILFAYIYSDNPSVETTYREFTTDYFLSGDLLWAGIALLSVTIVDDIFISKSRGRNNVSRNLLLTIGAIAIILGILMFIANISNPIPDEAMVVITISAISSFILASAYFKGYILKR
jgi:uncharacterized membrane protein